VLILLTLGLGVMSVDATGLGCAELPIGGSAQHSQAGRRYAAGITAGSIVLIAILVFA
jgi:hypothetical protein